MVRTILNFLFLPPRRTSSMMAMGTPAAIDITSLSRPTSEAISRRTFCTICGLTARMMMSHFFTSSRLSALTLILYSACRVSRFASDGSETKTFFDSMNEAESRPFIMASAMLPPPMNPIFLFFSTTMISS